MKIINLWENNFGHYLQGHVDTVAKVSKISVIDKTWLIKFKILDKKFNKYLIEKDQFQLMEYLSQSLIQKAI